MRRRAAQPGRPSARAGRHGCPAGGHAGRAADPAAAEVERWGVRVGCDLDAVLPDVDVGLPAARPARAHAPGLLPDDPRVRGEWGLDARRLRAAAAARHRAAPGSDEPRGRDHRRRRRRARRPSSPSRSPTASPCGWPASTCCSPAGHGDRSMSDRPHAAAGSSTPPPAPTPWPTSWSATADRRRRVRPGRRQRRGRGRDRLLGHARLRRPARPPARAGFEDAEDVATGTAAAAAGGFTAVCPMANTDPVTDSAAVAELVLAPGREVGLADVFPVGADHQGDAGRGADRAARAAPLRRPASTASPTTASRSRDALVMRRALKYATHIDAVDLQPRRGTRRSPTARRCTKASRLVARSACPAGRTRPRR